jgi:rhodanese-related sulfurtransferase
MIYDQKHQKGTSMKNLPHILTVLLLIIISAVSCARNNDSNSSKIVLSGEITNGHRIIYLDDLKGEIQLFVNRGDYVKFISSKNSSKLSIPDLAVTIKISDSIERSQVIKMKESGSYTLLYDEIQGTINVSDYNNRNYQELSVADAMKLLKNENPILLDVRTIGEYKQGHIDSALLIPVQELQFRLKEIESHKNDPLLIYCRSGNRSTVASKMLIENSFNKVYNLRYGIKDWIKQGGKVVK